VFLTDLYVPAFGISLGETKKVVVFEGEAKLGKVMAPAVTLSLNPEDFESPLSLQFAITKLMENLTKALEQPPEPKYMAEVRFKDHMGQPVTLAMTSERPYLRSVRTKLRQG
jgi:hypothetical protein